MRNSAKTHTPRIGIYAGAFDPVHSGHVSFALQAIREAKLDQVVFLPERRPRNRPGVEHYAHRVAMLKRALRPYEGLAVMEVVDRSFTVRRTFPMLQSVFRGSQLVLLMGSDTIDLVPQWPYAARLMQQCELVVGVRGGRQAETVDRFVRTWSLPAPAALTIFDSFAPDVSSSSIRQALRKGEWSQGLLSSVFRYARSEWLYASPSTAS